MSGPNDQDNWPTKSTTPQRRERYPSDVTDARWQRAESMLPAEPNLGRRRSTSLRDIVDAINYRWTTGCAWRMLPHDFPPWETVYTYFRRWQRNGLLKWTPIFGPPAKVDR